MGTTGARTQGTEPQRTYGQSVEAMSRPCTAFLAAVTQGHQFHHRHPKDQLTRAHIRGWTRQGFYLRNLQPSRPPLTHPEATLGGSGAPRMLEETDFL